MARARDRSGTARRAANSSVDRALRARGVDAGLDPGPADGTEPWQRQEREQIARLRQRAHAERMPGSGWRTALLVVLLVLCALAAGAAVVLTG